ncbi:MAG TPA: FmdB family zinc ribbon protein [Fimbriiglobus sp.]|jgi:putative FmdB family regulatory protein
MPTYDYVCDACGHEFEEWQSFKDDALTKCPKCKKKKLRRLFGGGAAILFKGSGFYETDYRSESYKNAEKADAPKTDAKPAEAAKTDGSATSPPPPPPAEKKGGSGKGKKDGK